MLQEKGELSAVFFHNSEPKPIDCIRVDGAADEGHHMKKHNSGGQRDIDQKKIATLITTRSSGSSYLNRVELQMGVWPMDTVTYIPSTLARLLYRSFHWKS